MGVGPDGLGDGDAKLGKLLGGSRGTFTPIEPHVEDECLDDSLLGRPGPAVEGKLLTEFDGSEYAFGQGAAIYDGGGVEVPP